MSDEQIVQIRRWHVPSRACLQIRYYWVWAAIHCQLVWIQQPDPEHQKIYWNCNVWIKIKKCQPATSPCSWNTKSEPDGSIGSHNPWEALLQTPYWKLNKPLRPNISCSPSSEVAGLNGIALWDVGQAILINRLLYASPVWWGFTDASDKQRLQVVLTRAQRLEFLSPSTPSLSELCGQADDTLFSAIVGNQYHVLHGLLPPIKSTGRDRALLPDDGPLSRQNFINRILTNIYYYAKLWLSFSISMTSYIGTSLL